MSITEIYSKRINKDKGGSPDIYQYENISRQLKVQIIHIWDDSLGDEHQYLDSIYLCRKAYEYIVNTLCREYGVFNLLDDSPNRRRNYYQELHEYFLGEKNIEKLLDVIELSFYVIDSYTRQFDYLHSAKYKERADAAIDELNKRFLEHAVGYQFINRQIIRIDSQYIHAEVVKPALLLLSEKAYKGAQDEYLKAHEHYRHKKHKEAISEALKSFESVMKVICEKRQWAFPSNVTAKGLIDTCFKNDLIPDYFQTQLGALRTLLESGVPTLRNKVGGHGQGGEIMEVPDYFVAYALHSTAVNILLLAEADKKLPI